MTHWAAEHIGTPWSASETHCWHFARRVWQDRFGWEVPEIVVDATDPRAARRAFAVGHDGTGWTPIAGVCAPVEGDAVLMAMGRHPCHVGIHLTLPDGPAVLHSVEGAGVICTAYAALVGMGYRVVGLYRWSGPCAQR